MNGGVRVAQSGVGVGVATTGQSWCKCITRGGGLQGSSTNRIN